MKTTEFIIPTPDFTHLSQYETWAAQNWLYPQGTDAAQLHVRDKLDEEVIEFREALVEGNPDAIISEGGDVLWTGHATGVNTGIPISEALAYSFPGVFSKDSIPVDLIDKTAMETYEGIATANFLDEIERNGNAAVINLKKWFRLKHIATDITPKNFSEAIVWTKHHRGCIALAQLALLTSYGIQAFAGASLRDAMEDNYQKIETRIATGRPVTKLPHNIHAK